MRQGLKAVLEAPDRETAQARFAVFRERWQARYPKVVASWARDLDRLLTFLAYPAPIRPVIRSTNLLERTFKELRRRFKVVEVFPSVEALERMTYWHLVRLNARWGERTVVASWPHEKTCSTCLRNVILRLHKKLDTTLPLASCQDFLLQRPGLMALFPLLLTLLP